MLLVISSMAGKSIKILRDSSTNPPFFRGFFHGISEPRLTPRGLTMVKLEVWQISQRSLSHRLWKKSWWMYREIIPFYPNYSGCCEWFFHLPRWISILETFPAIKLHLGWIYHDFSMDLPLAPPTIWWKLANWSIHHCLKTWLSDGYHPPMMVYWWFVSYYYYIYYYHQ